MSLYHEIGGDAVISAAVIDLWGRINTDTTLSPWFAHTEGRAFTGNLGDYLTVALGGPERYGGRSMRNAHSGLGITGEAFEVFLQRLGESFAAGGASGDVVQRVDARIRLLRAMIVERRSPPE